MPCQLMFPMVNAQTMKVFSCCLKLKTCKLSMQQYDYWIRRMTRGVSLLRVSFCCLCSLLWPHTCRIGYNISLSCCRNVGNIYCDVSKMLMLSNPENHVTMPTLTIHIKLQVKKIRYLHKFKMHGVLFDIFQTFCTQLFSKYCLHGYHVDHVLQGYMNWMLNFDITWPFNGCMCNSFDDSS